MSQIELYLKGFWKNLVLWEMSVHKLLSLLCKEKQIICQWIQKQLNSLCKPDFREYLTLE